jgi:hypothetical protein
MVIKKGDVITTKEMETIFDTHVHTDGIYDCTVGETSYQLACTKNPENYIVISISE